MQAGQPGNPSAPAPQDNKNINMDQFPNLVASRIVESEDMLDTWDPNDEVKPIREMSDEEKANVRQKTFKEFGGDNE